MAVEMRTAASLSQPTPSSLTSSPRTPSPLSLGLPRHVSPFPHSATHRSAAPATDKPRPSRSLSLRAQSSGNEPLLSQAQAQGLGQGQGQRARRGVEMAAAQAGVDIVKEAAEEVEKEDTTEAAVEYRDYAGTPYIPIYVMLPLNTIGMECYVTDPGGLKAGLAQLKAGGVDGVMVDCWWGIVERHQPQSYNWRGYRDLFQMVKEAGLKLQVVMSFHQCGGNVGDDVTIPLPQWVLDLGDLDVFFNDAQGRANTECLSWGVDKERVLAGRTGLEVYYDYMRSFRQEFDPFFQDGTIVEVEVGLGACGELRYPSYPESHGWKYPGIGEFVCYDKYMMKSLREAAVARGHAHWGVPPDNAGSYNYKPQDTGFFPDDGTYDGFYGRFFLRWYSDALIAHGDRVLALAGLAFEGTTIACKVSGIHWWYKTASHAAELTAGFYNSHNRDGYAALVQMMARHRATFNFTCVELRTQDQEGGFPEACCDPEGLVWQVLNAAWDAGVPIASENALPCYDRDGYEKILANSKPADDPDGHRLCAFTYLRLTEDLFKDHNWAEFTRFVARMHGEPNPMN